MPSRPEHTFDVENNKVVYKRRWTTKKKVALGCGIFWGVALITAGLLAAFMTPRVPTVTIISSEQTGKQLDVVNHYFAVNFSVHISVENRNYIDITAKKVDLDILYKNQNNMMVGELIQGPFVFHKRQVTYFTLNGGIVSRNATTVAEFYEDYISNGVNLRLTGPLTISVLGVSFNHDITYDTTLKQ